MVWIPNLRFGKFTETAKAMPRLNEHGLVENPNVTEENPLTTDDLGNEPHDEEVSAAYLKIIKLTEVDPNADSYAPVDDEKL
jgi:hypothetical protein